MTYCVPVHPWWPPVLYYLDQHWSQAITLLPSPMPLHTWKSACSLFWPDFAREGVDKGGHILCHSTFWADLEVPKIILLTFNPRIHFVIRLDKLGRMWSYSILVETGPLLNPSHSNSRPMNTFPLCFQALKWDLCRLMTVPPNFTLMWSACWTLDMNVRQLILTYDFITNTS